MQSYFKGQSDLAKSESGVESWDDSNSGSILEIPMQSMWEYDREADMIESIKNISRSMKALLDESPLYNSALDAAAGVFWNGDPADSSCIRSNELAEKNDLYNGEHVEEYVANYYHCDDNDEDNQLREYLLRKNKHDCHWWRKLKKLFGIN